MSDNPYGLDRDTYSPREFATIYSAHVAPVSYPTVLGWIELYRNTGGKHGVCGTKQPNGVRYRISREEVIRVLDASKGGTPHDVDGATPQP